METFSVKNPANGQELINQTQFDLRLLPDLVNRSRSAQTRWAGFSIRKRSQHLKLGQKYVLKHIDDIAKSISLNNGKPLVEALSSEVVPVLQTFRFAIKRAAQALRSEKISIGMAFPTKRAYVAYQPLGVLGIISPWNYPFSTPLTEIILGLIAGNGLIIKGSEVTGLVNEIIKKIIQAMQLPKDLVVVIDGGAEIGAALSRSRVDKIIFTGSTETGRKIMQSASQNLTPLVLELGGKDAMIVLEDASVEKAAAAAVVGGFYNSGQTCCSVERLLIHEKIEEEFIKHMINKMKQLRIGESASFNNDLGAITYTKQKIVYKNQLNDLAQKNATLTFGSNNFDGVKNFLEPIVVKAKKGMKVWDEETFGPIIAYQTFKTEEEAIQMNNDTPYGLTAVIYSGSCRRAEKLAEKLRVGVVVINDAPFTNAAASLPWGGRGESGFGKLHGLQGLRELTLQKIVVYDIFGQIKQLWWYPYSQYQYDFFKALAYIFNSSSLFERIKNIFKIMVSYFKMGPRI